MRRGKLNERPLHRAYLRLHLGAILCVPNLVACGAPEGSAAAALQSACAGAPLLWDVQAYDGRPGVPTSFVLRHRRAVGMLRWRSDLAVRYREQAGNVAGSGWCTGTLIDDDLWLTAGHCLDNEDVGKWRLPREKNGARLEPASLARELVVELRNEVGTSPQEAVSVDTAEVVRLEEYRYGGADYAILRLAGHPGLRNGVARIASREPEAGQSIAILQHPAGLPMKVGIGDVARVSDGRLFYDSLDTFGGSSGAGILAARTGQLIGIHTTGGCSAQGGANSGVTVAALAAVSPMIAALRDDSRDLLVGDWDRDGLADLAALVHGCLLPDTNHDELADIDQKQCAAEADADEYWVGVWQAGARPGLAWRKGDCVFLAADPTRPLCFGQEGKRFTVLPLDWDGDGRTDLGIRRGNCFGIDTNLDGELDVRDYCFGGGDTEDAYLAGRWTEDHHDSVAVRRGNTLLVDADRDGNADLTRSFGDGGDENQYLVGDWLGNQRDTPAVCRHGLCLIDHDGADDLPDEGRGFRGLAPQ